MNAVSRYFDNLKLRQGRLLQKDLWHWPTIYKTTHLDKKEKARRGIRKTVRLLGNFPGIWQRTIEQTHGGSCQWGATLFVGAGLGDVYVILNRLGSQDIDFIKFVKEKQNSPPIFCLHMEPRGYIDLLKYHDGIEYEIADRIYTTSQELVEKGGKFIRCPPYVHFHCGKSIDFLERTNVPVKKRGKIVLITSDLTDLSGHRRRLKFVEGLDRSGLDCEIWGRGDGLRRFKKYKGYAKTKWGVYKDAEYAIVLENSTDQDYWSEKIADALLSFAFPIYYGCQNINDYFPKDACYSISIDDVCVFDKIKHFINTSDFQSNLNRVNEARDIILKNENLYSFLDKEVSFF